MGENPCWVLRLIGMHPKFGRESAAAPARIAEPVHGFAALVGFSWWLFQWVPIYGVFNPRRPGLDMLVPREGVDLQSRDNPYNIIPT